MYCICSQETPLNCVKYKIYVTQKYPIKSINKNEVFQITWRIRSCKQPSNRARKARTKKGAVFPKNSYMKPPNGGPAATKARFKKNPTMDTVDILILSELKRIPTYKCPNYDVYTII